MSNSWWRWRRQTNGYMAKRLIDATGKQRPPASNLTTTTNTCIQGTDQDASIIYSLLNFVFFLSGPPPHAAATTPIRSGPPYALTAALPVAGWGAGITSGLTCKRTQNQTSQGDEGPSDNWSYAGRQAGSRRYSALWAFQFHGTTTTTTTTQKATLFLGRSQRSGAWAWPTLSPAPPLYQILHCLSPTGPQPPAQQAGRSTAHAHYTPRLHSPHLRSVLLCRGHQLPELGQHLLPVLEHCLALHAACAVHVRLRSGGKGAVMAMHTTQAACKFHKVVPN